MNTLNTGIAKLVKSAFKGCLALLLAVQTLYLSYAQVPYDRILNAADEPQNWLTYNGSYMSYATAYLIRSSRTMWGISSSSGCCRIRCSARGNRTLLWLTASCM